MRNVVHGSARRRTRTIQMKGTLLWKELIAGLFGGAAASPETNRPATTAELFTYVTHAELSSSPLVLMSRHRVIS